MQISWFIAANLLGPQRCYVNEERQFVHINKGSFSYHVKGETDLQDVTYEP